VFKELMPVITDRPLTITVASLADGKIRVCVVPQPQDKDIKINEKVGYKKEVAKIPDASIKALTTPLVLTGTPEELDAELPEKLTTYAGSHAQLQNGIAQATQEITDALKAIEERDKAKSKSKTAAAPSKKEGNEKKAEASTAAADMLPLNWIKQTAAPAPPTAPNGTGAITTDSDDHETEEEVSQQCQ